MARLFDVLTVLALGYLTVKFDIGNPTMRLLGVQNSQTFSEYLSSNKQVMRRLHPDTNPDANTDTFELVQDLHSRFLKTERQHRSYSVALFAVGDLHTDDMVKIRSVLTVVAQMYIADSVSGVFIFSKIQGGKRIFCGLLVLVLFLAIQAGILLIYVRYLLMGESDLVLWTRELIMSKYTREWFAQSALGQLVSLFSLAQVWIMFLLSSAIGYFNKRENDYAKLFVELMQKLRLQGPQQMTNLEEHKQSLRDAISTIDEADKPVSRLWKWLQTILVIATILMMLSQGI